MGGIVCACVNKSTTTTLNMSSVSAADDEETAVAVAGDEAFGDLIHDENGQQKKEVGGGGGGGRAIAAEAIADEVSDGDVQHGIDCLCKPCEPLKILKLVERLSSTTNSIEMQIIINKYVSVKYTRI